jgi:chorismate synthase
VQRYLDRRRPGQSELTTSRKEADEVEILSGVFRGQTTGTPISLLIRNTAQRSQDYDELESYYRPGHADYTYEGKYGIRDHRGGGRSSGRETIGRVAAGAIAAKFLAELGIHIHGYTKYIGNISIAPQFSDPEYWAKAQEVDSLTRMPDPVADQAAQQLMKEVREDADSLGGVIECVMLGVPIGLGEPVFGKLDAELSKAIMSIGAVKAVEIGDGVKAVTLRGSQSNDAPGGTTNHAGGILGGISNGNPIVLRAHVKPTPSIAREQQTLNRDHEEITVSIKGRHDPIIVPRAVVVVEAMTALVLADTVLMNMGTKLEAVKRFYE